MNDAIENLLPILAGSDWTTKAGAAAGALFFLSWIAGKGLMLFLQRPATHSFFAAGLRTADVPGIFLARVLQAGPLHVLTGPILCLAVFAFFWAFAVFDKILGAQKPDVLKLVAALESVLSKAGSSDRKLYIQAKTMPAEKVEAVSQMAAAVAAKPGELLDSERAVLASARAVGEGLQASRLESKE